jgi:hypothetical protein
LKVSGPPRFQYSQQFQLLLRSLDVKGHIGFGSYGGSDRWFPTSLVGAEESIWKKLEEPESTSRTPACHIIDEEKLLIWLKLREKNRGRGADEDDDEEEWTSASDDGFSRDDSDAEESESAEEVYEVEDEGEASDDDYEPWNEANDGIAALVFSAEGDMRQAINNLQSTSAGFGFVSGDNVTTPKAIPCRNRLCEFEDVRATLPSFTTIPTFQREGANRSP